LAPAAATQGLLDEQEMTMKCLSLCAALLPALAIADGRCTASSTTLAPTVVELYTSEGCSSCPPADRWLSTLKGRPDVLALAFHVTYWDRLGWPDRFARPEYTQRQYALAQQAGRSNVYTPQVLVNGQDWRRWPLLPAASAADAPMLSLVREGDQVTLTVAPGGAPNQRWAGHWVVLEDGHQSRVKAGENAGETLKHDHVVRQFQPVAAWAAAAGQKQQLRVSRGDANFPRRVAFIVVDAASHKPLQAVALAC
jgi:hypothetical protein